MSNVHHRLVPRCLKIKTQSHSLGTRFAGPPCWWRRRWSPASAPCPAPGSQWPGSAANWFYRLHPDPEPEPGSPLTPQAWTAANKQKHTHHIRAGFNCSRASYDKDGFKSKTIFAFCFVSTEEKSSILLLNGNKNRMQDFNESQTCT